MSLCNFGNFRTISYEEYGALRAILVPGRRAQLTENWREPTNRDGIYQASKSMIFVASENGRLSPGDPQASVDMPLMFRDSMSGLEMVVRNKWLAWSYCNQRGNRKQKSSFEASRATMMTMFPVRQELSI